MQGGAGLTLLAATIGATLERAGEHPVEAGQLQAALDRVLEVTAALWATGDPETALANSSSYLEAVGHVVVAWIWLEQLLVADGKSGDFYDGKRQAAQYFFRYELPKTGPMLDLLSSLDRTTVEMRDSWF
jgi:hypothetical protein